MLSTPYPQFVQAVSVLKQCIVATDRTAVIALRPSPSRLGRAFRSIVPEFPQGQEWRIYNHCAAVTRLYAVFERFVEDIGAAWLQCLPSLYSDYSQLPKQVCNEHKNGVSRILQKAGEGRYKHITPAAILQGLYRGLLTSHPYDLPVSLFVVPDRNLRPDILAQFFQKIGLPDVKQWIKAHPDVTAFMVENYGGQQSAEGQLDTFIDFRNDAAHGYDIDEVLSETELLTLADFLVVLGSVLVEFVEMQYWRRRCANDEQFIFGTVTEYFNVPDAFIAKVKNGSVTVGQSLLVLEKNRCRRILVQAIQANDVDVQLYTATTETELGFKFSEHVPIGTELINTNGGRDMPIFLQEGI